MPTRRMWWICRILACIVLRETEFPAEPFVVFADVPAHPDRITGEIYSIPRDPPLEAIDIDAIDNASSIYRQVTGIGDSLENAMSSLDNVEYIDVNVDEEAPVDYPEKGRPKEAYWGTVTIEQHESVGKTVTAFLDNLSTAASSMADHRDAYDPQP